MIYVEPEVHLISQPYINDENLYDYLASIGAEDWDAKECERYSGDRPNPGAEIAEVMGRICYRSFVPGLNKNVTKIREFNDEYLANIIKSGHEAVLEHVQVSFVFHNVSRVLCYQAGTEILTDQGWKYIECLKNEKLLTLNPQTRKARWSKNHKTHVFDYKGNLYYMKSSQWESPAVTPDHLMWASQYDTRENRGLSNAEVVDRHMSKIPCNYLLGKRFIISHSAPLAEPEDINTITIGDYTYPANEFFFWLGLIVTDGTLAKESNRIAIIQTKQDNFELIRWTMNRLFKDRWKEYPTTFAISDRALWDWVTINIGRTKDQMDFTALYNYSPRLLNKFIEGAILGDGSVTKGHRVIYTSYDRPAKDFQTILALCGFSSNVRWVDRVGHTHELNGKDCTTTLPQYVVSIHKKGESMVRVEHQQILPYDGKVYCPQTEDGLVFVRKEGMAFWCGNTHELVRHRIGVAISQESLRYVRLDELRAYVPECIRDRPELLKVMDDAFAYAEAAQSKLQAMAEIDGLSFEKKKELTSAFRRMAPMGLATTIGWSANMRALRHIIQQRTALGAEEEIRLLFNKVYDCLIDNEYGVFFPGAAKSLDGTITVY